MAYELFDKDNISAPWRYGMIELPPEHLVAVTNTLNIKKHWWSKRENKVLMDIILELFERTEVKLGFFPDGFGYDILFVEGEPELEEVQLNLYGEVRHEGAYAFASLTRNAMYIRIDTLSRKIMQHEFSHLLFHKMLRGDRVNYITHEVIAKLGEKA